MEIHKAGQAARTDWSPNTEHCGPVVVAASVECSLSNWPAYTGSQSSPVPQDPAKDGILPALHITSLPSFHEWVNGMNAYMSSRQKGNNFF